MKKVIIGIVIVGIFGVLLDAASRSSNGRISVSSPVATQQPTPPSAPRTPTSYHPELEFHYLQMINEVSNNYYNYVTTGTKKSKGGYTLWAYHSFFGQYEFSIGHFGKDVAAWINQNRAKLKLGKITRVGVHGTGPYASYTYYEVN